MATNIMLSLPRLTKTYHTKPYPAISPDRPQSSLKGMTILIIGGGTLQTTLPCKANSPAPATGIGLATTHAFAQAGASTIALMARTKAPMLEAKHDIESKYPGTKVQVYAASVTSRPDIDRVLSSLGGGIDILVLNAGHAPARPRPPQTWRQTSTSTSSGL